MSRGAPAGEPDERPDDGSAPDDAARGARLEEAPGHQLDDPSGSRGLASRFPVGMGTLP